MTFAGKVALVSGAARGIGLGAAEALAREGAIVYGVDRDGTGDEAFASLREAGGDAAFLRLDVTDWSGWQSVIDRIERERGSLDILVNSAGIIRRGSIEDTPFETFRQASDVNVGGVYNGMRAALPLMKRRGSTEPRAAIVNLASMASFNGVPHFAGYAASKAAVQSLTKTAALEFARLGYPVRVNAVHPGTIDTEMSRDTVRQALANGQTEEQLRVRSIARHPLARLGTVEDVVFAILYLLDDRSSYTTGFSLTVAGGRGAGEW